MRKSLCVLSIIFIGLIFCAAANAAVEPVITANGMTGTVHTAEDSAVTIRVQLSPGEKEGTDADWWLAVYAFGRWYGYDLSGELKDLGDSPDIGSFRPVYQGALVTLPSSVILEIPRMPAGTYSLYFGVDTNMNGKIDTDSLVLDTVCILTDSVSPQYYKIPGVTPENRNQPVIKTDKLLDFIPLQNGYGVRVIESGDQHILRIVPLSDPESGQVLSELVLDENPYSGMIANGNMLYSVLSRPATFVSLDEFFKYGSNKDTKIQVIDLSVPQLPVKRGSLELTSTYYLPSQTISSPPINWGMIFQMNGSVLVLPYSTGKAYQGTPGEDMVSLINNTDQAAYDAEKRVRVVDFSDPDQPKEISDMLLSDVRGVSGCFMNGRILYVSHFKNTDTGSEYYLSRIDFSSPAAPLQSASVDIPAPCIGTDPLGMYAFTVGGGTLSSLKLGTDRADLADKVEMKGSYNRDMIISDGFAYLSGSGGIVIADLSSPENLGFYEYRLMDDANTNTNINICYVKNRRIFASVNISKVYDDDARYMICYDASDPRSLRVDSFFDRTGINIYNFAFSDDNAYLALGYYGLWIGSISN